MPSENDPEFDDSPASARDEVTDHSPTDPGKTWVPADRELSRWSDTGDPPDPLPETEAGSLDGFESSPENEEEPSPDEEPLEPPRQFGEYELLDRVGRGGMGIVYKARDRRLDRIVALKILRAGTTRSEKQVERFVREAKAAARLDHANIVPCYEFGEFQGWQYLTMAFVHGDSLQHRLQSGPMQPRAAALMIQALASAVSHAHKQGVIHRDIKPGNVLLGDDGRPRLTDFGIAKLLDPVNPHINPTQLTLVGQALGTPGYMAPEQSAGRRWEIGPAVDIYALGGVLVAALTGHPASGDSLETLAQQVPDDLQVICDRCLAYNPLDRYPNADALLKDLEIYLKGDTLTSTLAPPQQNEVTITLPEVTLRFSKSQVLLIAGFILAVLICSFLLATWITRGWRDPEPSSRQETAVPEALNLPPGPSQRQNPPEDAPVRSHLEVLIDRGSGPHPLEEMATLPLKSTDKILVDVKVDRDQNAYLYVVRVNTRGEGSLINENRPVEISPFGGDRDSVPEDRPAKEHFRIRGEAKELLPIDRTGPAGMMTLVLLSRNQPLDTESLKQLNRGLAALNPRHQAAPSELAVHRFSLRPLQPPMPRKPSPDALDWEPLAEDHPTMVTLTELGEILRLYSNHIEAVSIAVPEIPSGTTAENE